MKKKNSIKRAQSQAGLSFAERKNFRLQAKHKILLTLVALFAMTAGAWAGKATVFEVDFSSTPTATTGSMRIGNMASTSSVMINQSANSIYTIRLGAAYNYSANRYVSIKPETGSFQTGDTLLIAVCYSNSGTKTAKADIYAANGTTLLFTTAPGINGQNESGDPVVEKFVLEQDADSLLIGRSSSADIVTYVTTLKVLRPAPSLAVTWNAATNTGTFDMPASDVVLTPIYAPVAQWATESDVALLPTAAEGIFAGTTDPIIVEGTVALGQGTVMYAVTSTNQATAPELSAFSATVPTAENIADEGADVLVWYYIQGADTPDGQEATAENTFNDSEICATPLEVSVLSNKFDITFNAANANTIESGKATVTVGGTAATVTEGKLEGVKMGSEVKMTAKQGYKFRKVEAKKKASAPTLKDAFADGATVVITYTWMDTNVTTFTYTNNGGNYTGNTTGDDAEYFANGMSMDGMTLKFTASNPDTSEANVSIDFDTDTNEYVVSKDSLFTSFTISVNGTDVTSQLTEVVDETGD